MLRCLPVFFLLFLFILACLPSRAQPVSWTGSSGNELWNDPANWTGGIIPGAPALITLDNSSFPGSYRVQLPDIPVTAHSIVVRPSPGNTIELLLPATNINNDALILTGTGYPLLLGNGGIFRNACGISSGSSIVLADSFRIENGGRYIHSTRGTHAASLLAKLSAAPGTERGVFEFDVPRASYTISVSNRTYGTLSLRSTAYGMPVNYTCSGSNPLRIRGDLDLGAAVSLSVDLATAKGNISVSGDLLQQSGTLNLGSGAGDSTTLSLTGEFIQQAGAVLTSATNAFPWIEFNGTARQTFSPAGEITGNAGVRISNAAGVQLGHSLTLEHAFDLSAGFLITTDDWLLTLGDTCKLISDSTRASTFVDGPLCRQLAPGTQAAGFPVGAGGAGGAQRWLAMKEAGGIFTVSYIPENPAAFSGQMGTGIDHISSKEYWLLKTSGPVAGKIELSHTVPQSGSITEPSVLRVSRLQGNTWKDAGESAYTGDLLKGSVVSFPVTDLTDSYLTLASALAMENPLPLESVSLSVKRVDDRIRFRWSYQQPEQPAGFELIQTGPNHNDRVLAHIDAEKGRLEYGWSMPDTLDANPAIRWRVDLVDAQGKRRHGKSVLLPGQPVVVPDLYFTGGPGSASKLWLTAARKGSCSFGIYSATGGLVYSGSWDYQPGKNEKILQMPVVSRAVYFLRVHFEQGGEVTLRLPL